MMKLRTRATVTCDHAGCDKEDYVEFGGMDNPEMVCRLHFAGMGWDFAPKFPNRVLCPTHRGASADHNRSLLEASRS